MRDTKPTCSKIMYFFYLWKWRQVQAQCFSSHNLEHLRVEFRTRQKCKKKGHKINFNAMSKRKSSQVLLLHQINLAVFSGNSQNKRVQYPRVCIYLQAILCNHGRFSDQIPSKNNDLQSVLSWCCQSSVKWHVWACLRVGLCCTGHTKTGKDQKRKGESLQGQRLEKAGHRKLFYWRMTQKRKQ